MYVPNLDSLVFYQTLNSGLHKDLAEQLLTEIDPTNNSGLKTTERWVKCVEGNAKAYGWSHALFLMQVISKMKGYLVPF